MAQAGELKYHLFFGGGGGGAGSLFAIDRSVESC